MPDDESNELLTDFEPDDENSELVEEKVRSVPDPVPAQVPAPEEIKDGLKSTPVIWISAILSAFFLLGIYDFGTSR